MKHIPDEFKKDPQLMTMHLENCVQSYWEVQKFQDIKPLFFNILKKSHYIYNRFNEEMKSDEDYIYALLRHDYFFKQPKDSFLPYEKVNIIQLIPDKIQKQLIKEYQEIFSNDLNKPIGTTPTDDDLLDYSRKKYTNLYLQKQLSSKQEVVKIKI